MKQSSNFSNLPIKAASRPNQMTWGAVTLVGYCIPLLLNIGYSAKGKPVAQGQYVVSDSRCPALHDVGFEWWEAGQRPRRGRSPVEHRGTFVRSSIHLFIRSFIPPFIRPLRPQISLILALSAHSVSGWKNKSPPVFYRTWSPSGPLLKKHLKHLFCHFWTHFQEWMDRRMDQQTNEQTKPLIKLCVCN